jgi:hypothetical protein
MYVHGKKCDHGSSTMAVDGYIHKMIANQDARAGWVYAATNADRTLLKVGGTDQCPFCRVQRIHKLPKGHGKVRMELLGFSWGDDWRVYEQQVIALLGKPRHGHEWFDYDQRWEYLKQNELITCIDTVKRRCSRWACDRMQAYCDARA